MGYCPRCGENSSLSAGTNERERTPAVLRIPAASRIVHLSGLGDETEGVITYGGTRFRVTRAGADWLLRPLE